MSIVFSVFGDTISETLGQTEFLTAVGQLKFRGTSHLLRSPTSIVAYLKKLSSGDAVSGNGIVSAATPPPTYRVETSTSQSQSLLGDSGLIIMTDVQADLQSYDVATHCVRVKRSGTILDIHSLWDIERNLYLIFISLYELVANL